MGQFGDPVAFQSSDFRLPRISVTLAHRDTNVHMSELIFLIDEAPEGGYTARALGHSIFTEADHLESLRANIREAVRCHFDDGKAPPVIRLHFVREEVMPA